MKISIITVCYNSEKTIEDTINSVASQNYTNIEYIVIDGGSSDNTNEIIRKNSEYIDVHVSEPDDGLYDAMNKGLNMATGDVVGILNSDDFFPDSRVIESIAQKFIDQKVKMSYGNLLYVKEKKPDVGVRLWKSKPFKEKLLYSSWVPPHPTFYVRREVINELGLYDTRNRLAADYELLIRYFMKYGKHSVYINKTLVHMRCGGESNNSLRNIVKQNNEVYSAAKKHGIKVNYLRFFAIKFGRKVFEYYRAKKNSGAI